MSRGRSSVQDEAEKQKGRDEQEKALREKAAAEEKQRQDEARQRQNIEAQQRDWRNQEAFERDAGRPAGRSRGGRGRDLGR